MVDTPEAKQNVRDALERLRIGGRTEHRVLELRRADNGERIWVQWCIQGSAEADHSTRSMFIDITQQVLLEQERARLTAQNVYLQEEIKSDHNFEEIIGATG